MTGGYALSMGVRVGLVAWAVVVCLPLTAAGLLALALGVYSYDSTPSTAEKVLWWSWSIAPLVLLGVTLYSATTERWTRVTVAALAAASAALAFLVVPVVVP